MDDVVFVIDGILSSFLKKKFCICNTKKIFGRKIHRYMCLFLDHSKNIDNWMFKLSKHKCKTWVAKVRAGTHTCDVRLHVCMCVRKGIKNMCAMCVRAGIFKLVTHHTRATALDNIVNQFLHFKTKMEVKYKCNICKSIISATSSSNWNGTF